MRSFPVVCRGEKCFAPFLAGGTGIVVVTEIQSFLLVGFQIHGVHDILVEQVFQCVLELGARDGVIVQHPLQGIEIVERTRRRVIGETVHDGVGIHASGALLFGIFPGFPRAAFVKAFLARGQSA